MTAVSTIPSMEASIRARQERWQSFLEPDAPPGFLFHVHYNDPQAGLPSAPPKWPDHVAERIEWAWKSYEHMCAQSEWLHDDHIPYLNNMTGTEVFAEAFGCRVERPDHTNPFALPCVHTAAEADALQVPELSTSTLAYLFDIADALVERAGPGAICKPVDIQSPMDIAALIWDKADLFVAMIDTPDAVKHLAAKVRTLLTAFLDEWFSRYGTHYVAHYPDYYMCGGMTLSEDEIGAVNADMFEEFFLEELVALSERYGGIGIHCCADAYHQWAGLKKVPGLRVLNLCKAPTRDPEHIRQAYDFFDGAVAQMHYGWNPEGPAATWPGQFPAGRRVIFELPARTRDEAKVICDELNARRGDL